MRPYHIFKRLIDITLSFLGIILFSPVYIIIALLEKITSKGPAVYVHERVAKDGKLFKVYKFRTMVVNARELQEKRVPLDKLITPLGAFLRKTFLDETLQLFNLFKGDVSFIGPRPLDKEIYTSLVKSNRKWKNVVKIKPGLTSIESVADYLFGHDRKNYELKFKGLLKKDIHWNFSHEKDAWASFYEHRYLLDTYYINHESFLLDIRILSHTFFLIVIEFFLRRSK